LDHIGQEKPKDKSWKWIKPQMRWSQRIPAQPYKCPPKYQEEKIHTPYLVGNPKCQLIQRGHVPLVMCYQIYRFDFFVLHRLKYAIGFFVMI
jgi:hypothetical protein